MESIACTPSPFLLESMRSVGYTLSTALADIIDNSIAAQAKNVNIVYFNSGEAPFIAIVDDGYGMDYSTAVNAMKLGGMDPRGFRRGEDLGRFGLGMKTASLSQARSLLLITKVNRLTTNLKWDLDTVAGKNRWELEQLSSQEVASLLPMRVQELLHAEHGTCIYLEKLDRLGNTAGLEIRDLDSAMRECADYLSLVFHRYLHPYPFDPIQKLSIRINGRELRHLDPFLIENTRTQVGPTQRLGSTGATLTGYTLPYQNKLTSNDRHLLDLSDEKGKTLFETQGFYIYRAFRLITWGSWFRLLHRKEATKLSRVRVDIPNSLDDEWTLDIKKSAATPPKQIRLAMKNYVETLAKPSREVQKFRGRKTGREADARIWNVISDRDNAFRYEINDSNPVIGSFINTLQPHQVESFRAIAKLLSQAMPLEDMQSRFARDEKSSEGTLPREQLLAFAQACWSLYSDGKMTPEQFVECYKLKEPFSLSDDAENILEAVTHG